MTFDIGLQEHWICFAKRQFMQWHLLNWNKLLRQEVIRTKLRIIIIIISVILIA